MRLGSKEYRQFVGIARGSTGEVWHQLLLARDLNYISNETYQELRSGYDRVIQMLSRLSQSLGNEPRTRPRDTITNTAFSHDGHEHVFSVFIPYPFTLILPRFFRQAESS